MAKLILASSSLGRKKLLSYLKIPFKIIHSDLDEEKTIGKDPLATLRLRSKLKGETVAGKILKKDIKLSHLIISADSGAILDNRLIGKPKSKVEAVSMLRILSGRTHNFITAINIIKLQNNITKNILETYDESFVTFRILSPDDIEFYLSVTDFTRYAGSYALISAQNFITKVKGSLSNVIGLPLEIVAPVLIKEILHKRQSGQNNSRHGY